MDKQEFANSYSLPIGPGSMYAPPPYLYRGVEDCFIVYETEAAGVEALLPPGLEIADETPTCIAWARWVPFSTFGAYHEAYIMIRANYGETTYLYQPFIFVDNEIPLGAGREIWGYAKKLAVFERNWGGDGTPFGEQMVFTVERPKGQRIMTATMVADRLADPAELEDTPVLSTRIIPNSEAGKRPSVAELVRLDVPATLHTAPDGTPKLFAGRGSLTMDTVSSVDPWHLLAPTKIVECYFGVYDFDLPHGRVIHNYLEDEEMWEGIETQAALAV
jgi:acetoacetate decarboxylase